MLVAVTGLTPCDFNRLVDSRNFQEKTLSINIGCLIVMFACLIFEFVDEIWPYAQTFLLF